MSIRTAILPETLQALEAKFLSKTCLPKMLDLIHNKKSSAPSSQESLAMKYCGSALYTGRPLNSVVIFMTGASGTGKSSSINSLLADTELCMINDSASETKNVALIRKTVRVNTFNPVLQGYLTFVDVPGTFDTNGTENEANNLALVQKFRNTRPELENRSDSKFPCVRKRVYPNIVLFVVSAADTRLAGKDSRLATSIKAFQATAELIDREKPNVIVVLTQAMTLPRDKTKFINKLAQITKTIQTQFDELLEIKNVLVVPVENEPQDYGLEKHGDFYKLPNGQVTPLNVFNAMIETLDKNKDILGSLLVSTYLKNIDLMNNTKAEVSQFDQTPTKEEVAKVAQDLRNLGSISLLNLESSVVIPSFQFQSLAHGYCPVTEKIKPVTPLISSGDVKTVEIEKSKFKIPEYVQVYANKETRFHRLSAMDKREYEEQMGQSYGLEVGYKLIVHGSLEGRWIDGSRGSSKICMLSMVQEMQVATLKLENPNRLSQTSEFSSDMSELPSTYTSSTAEHFQAFFSKWGTHMIIEQAVGGAIQLNCTVKQASLSREQVLKIETEVACALKDIFSAGRIKTGFSDKWFDLQSVGISDTHLRINGGTPPAIVNWNAVSKEELQKWANTVPYNPAELQTSIKLYPYYNFLSYGSQYRALRKATEEYLSNMLIEKINRKLEAVNVVVEGRSSTATPATTYTYNGNWCKALDPFPWPINDGGIFGGILNPYPNLDRWLKK